MNRQQIGDRFFSSLPAVLFLFLSVLSAGRAVYAQGTSTDRGFNPGKSYAMSEIETVSMQSGNLMLNMPLGSLPPGRGGMSASVGLHYNSKLYDNVTFYNDTAGDYVDQLQKSEDGGWRYNYAFRLDFEGKRGALCNGEDDRGYYIFKPVIVMPDGSRHALSVAGYTDEGGYVPFYPNGRKNCGREGSVDFGGTIDYFTTDGTFLRLAVTPDSGTDMKNTAWTLYLPDGGRVEHYAPTARPDTNVAQRVYDRNGNFTEVVENPSDPAYANRKTTYLRDGVGRKIVIDYDAGANQDWIRSKGTGGADVVTKVQWRSIVAHKTYNGCNMYPLAVGCAAQTLNNTMKVVDKIYLPQQAGNPSSDSDLFYEFDYNADAVSNPSPGWGEVKKVVLPSGAYGEYEYENDGDNNIYTAAAVRNRPIEKTLTYLSEYDGAAPTNVVDTWTYAVTYFSPSAASYDWQVETSTVTAPNGGATTEYYSTGTASPYAYMDDEVWKTVGPDGSVVEKYYQSSVPRDPADLYKSNRFVKYEFATVPSNAGAPSKTAIKEYSQDKNGNATEVKEYEFVAYSTIPRDGGGRPNALPSGISSSLKRVTKTDYYNDTPDSATNVYNDTDSYHLAGNPRLLRLAKSAEVRNAAGTPQSRSEIVYDFTSYSTNTKAGNATGTKTWDSFKGGATQAYSNPLTTTNSISSSVVYDNFGNPTQTTDAKGVQTTVTYGCIDGQAACAASPWLQNLYPTKTEVASNTALKRTSTSVYDFYTGLATSTTDVDNAVTGATVYDELGRPVKSIAAAGTPLEVWTQTEYNDLGRYVIVRSDLEAKGDGRKVATQFYDQLGRVRLSKTLENAAQNATNETDGIKVQTRYKSRGDCTFDGQVTTQVCTFQLTSNPYRSANTSDAAANEPTMGWTRSQSINNGRHSETETFSTSPGVNLPAPWGGNNLSTGKVLTDTDADRTLVTDQAGKKRISKTNALGQLTDVWEIMAASDPATVPVSFPATSGTAYSAYQTSYQYDILSNLTQVSQQNGSSGTQTRSFAYSTLSRLLSAANPESGTISYIYDDNGNLVRKTDARTVKTIYDYDALNQIIKRCYTKPSPSSTPANCAGMTTQVASVDTPAVEYTYGNTPGKYGKLIKVDNGLSRTEYTEFDVLGRVKKSKQFTDNTAYPEMTYTYNLSGALVEQKYPSGRVVKNVIDNNGDLSMVQSKKNSNFGFWNYAQNFSYNAAGAVTSLQLGNFKWESTVFNSRLQPTQIALGATQSATNVLKLNYEYGELQSNGTVDAAKNNGNIGKQTILVPTVGSTPGFTAVQTYNYDSLNRIKDAKEVIGSTEQWKQTFSYDRFGNRNFDEANTSADPVSFPKGCGTAPSLSMCAADKKIFNPSINAANDNRIDTTNGYTFDFSGNTTRDAQNRKFTYDGENKQIKVETVDVNGTVTGTLGEYFYDGDGKRVKKYSLENNQWLTTLFVYDASGKLVEEYSTVLATTPQVSYLTNDHLGSPRINTDQNGAVTARHDYKPFGEEIARTNYGADDVRKQFTSYERDTESELDYAQARYYSNQHGRFTSTDPILMSYKRAVDPQRINLYIYVRNNPLKFVDADGEDINEPTELNEEDQKAYDKWKAEYLATEAGRKTWERYQNDKNFTLNIVVADRGSDGKNRSARVGDYKFDKNGNFIGSTMTLGKNLGKGLPGDTNSYPVSSALDTKNSAQIGAAKIAHEFGHLDDLKSLGTTFYEQQKIIDAINTRMGELGSQKRYGELGTDPTLKNLNESFQKRFGVTSDQEGINRENRAEKQAIPTIRQIFGKSLSDGANKAMTKLDKGN